MVRVAYPRVKPTPVSSTKKIAEMILTSPIPTSKITPKIRIDATPAISMPVSAALISSWHGLGM